MRVLLALLVAMAGACTLVATSEPLQRGCDSGSKACILVTGEPGCVDLADPAYGCASSSCVPCTLQNASETCGPDGACAVGTCDRGRGNCNGNASDGCETSLEDDYDNCTTCGHSCEDDLREMPNTISARCRSMRCQVDECEPGFADCDGAAGNGCERELAPELCGSCDGCPEGTECNESSQACE